MSKLDKATWLEKPVAMRLKYSQAALCDLRSIFIQNARKFGLQQADTYRDGLLGSLAFIAERPLAIPEYRNSKRAVRVHRYQSEVVVFEVREDEVFVGRIVHGLRDITIALTSPFALPTRTHYISGAARRVRIPISPGP